MVFGEVMRESRSYGQPVGGNLGGDTAGEAQLGEIGCQAVANVHGGGHALFGENLTLGKMGLRTAVGLQQDFNVDVCGTGRFVQRGFHIDLTFFLEQGQPSGGGPQRSRHGYEMAGTGGSSGHGCAFDGSDQGNCDEGRWAI